MQLSFKYIYIMEAISLNFNQMLFFIMNTSLFIICYIYIVKFLRSPKNIVLSIDIFEMSIFYNILILFSISINLKNNDFEMVLIDYNRLIKLLL